MRLAGGFAHPHPRAVNVSGASTFCNAGSCHQDYHLGTDCVVIQFDYIRLHAGARALNYLSDAHAMPDSGMRHGNDHREPPNFTPIALNNLILVQQRRHGFGFRLDAGERL